MISIVYILCPVRIYGTEISLFVRKNRILAEHVHHYKCPFSTQFAIAIGPAFTLLGCLSQITPCTCSNHSWGQLRANSNMKNMHTFFSFPSVRPYTTYIRVRVRDIFVEHTLNRRNIRVEKGGLGIAWVCMMSCSSPMVWSKRDALAVWSWTLRCVGVPIYMVFVLICTHVNGGDGHSTPH